MSNRFENVLDIGTNKKIGRKFGSRIVELGVWGSTPTSNFFYSLLFIILFFHSPILNACLFVLEAAKH